MQATCGAAKQQLGLERSCLNRTDEAHKVYSRFDPSIGRTDFCCSVAILTQTYYFLRLVLVEVMRRQFLHSVTIAALAFFFAADLIVQAPPAQAVDCPTPIEGAVVCFNGQGGNGPDGDDGVVVGENADPGQPGTVRNDTYNGPAILPAGNNTAGIRSTTSGGNGGIGGESDILGNAGDGGDGGAGAGLTLTNNAGINTNGSGSSGIVAVANGGNGGNAGDAGIIGGGGDGGNGGNAGTVFLTNNGSISAIGTESFGILAQANGGRGGNGGSGGASGEGGEPARGGNVTVFNAGPITTQGDKASGILAQSVGGGGGAAGSGGIGPLVRWGGKATGGHDGGNVEVTSTQNITTTGIEANGILAQSVGGAGGNASGAVGIVALGGNAAGGGDGKAVTVNAAGRIETNSARSHGILAQSIGGGGGSGGFAVGIVAIGGDGGGGGKGGDVVVRRAAGPDLVIDTDGERSFGIFAQSVGGGGGDGGFAGAVGPNVALSLGGKGTGGGDAGKATVEIAGPGSITTRGVGSIGIMAQSVGGGGGNGGLAGSLALGSLAVGGDGGTGGIGGDVDLNNAFIDPVTGALSNGLTITTFGDQAHGLYAQSVGGGGGRGGAALAIAAGGTISVSVGGKGGAGGDAGNTVALRNAGDVTANGQNAHAINAQSIGGGGGDGGFAFSLSGMGSPFSLAIGGDGNAAGNGKAVNVASTGGNLKTTKDNSHAVYAVSIGGGGGSGGIGGAGALTAAVGIGGKGDSGGNGGAVRVDLLDGVGEINTIDTDGFMSNGIVARSVGGGGGEGALGVGASFVAGLGIGGSGADGGDASTVLVNNDLDITTRGTLSNGILAQSVGGGGGDGGTAVSINPLSIIAANVSVGGTGGKGGKADKVEVNNNANISVHGAGSKAIIAQAIGGGGGKGGSGYSLGVNVGIPGLIPGASGKFTIGGTGGDGGDAADVTVRSTGSLTSDGAGTVFTREGAVHGGGILAQSIGGGGGVGGAAETKSLGLFSSLNLDLAIGGSGGVGGDGKNVLVETYHDGTGNSTITTKGFNAVGILAQSIGGGGGAGGRADTWQKNIGANPALPALTVGVAIGGSACKANPTPTPEQPGECMTADGGTVTVKNAVNITTDGILAHGIVAESVGGGGGVGGSAMSFSDVDGPTGNKQLKANVSVGGTAGGGGNGGLVDVTNTGNITTNKSSSVGIWAHSIGGGGGGGGGGSADADLMAPGTGQNYAGAISVGGTGGQGGHGGEVKVNNSGTIDTKFGRDSIGILAQSVGGGGGYGGAARANISAADESALGGSLGLGIGGRGNSQGNGGKVDVTNTGKITTGGEDAHAIVAQSIGGGGGVGGLGSAGNAGKYQIGGGFGGTGGGDANIDGGSTGDGGTVKVTNSGDLTTSGRQTFAILAQSLGGGGGAGGVGATTGSGGTASINASLGGAGGASGNGGEVEVINSGGLDGTSLVRTTGDGSHAIVAQSIGGGGGAGGASNSANSAQYNIGASLAGDGGASGAGNKVTVKNQVGAMVKTEGHFAYGILAQSIGGGGGAGGAGSRTTASGDVALDFVMGGDGGSSGSGGDVIVENSGIIETLGILAHGVVAQSVGGGGGVGGAAKAANSSDYNIGAGLAGSGGGSGGSGNVSVTNFANAQIITRGFGAHGILAQSIGGGGGAGGTAESSAGGSLGVSFTLGGSGGSAGDSGVRDAGGNVIGNAVTVTNAGLIETFSDLSFGILAQSIGGGGGTGGGGLGSASSETKIGGGLAGSGGSSGDGGNVVVNNQATGTIRTHGTDAVGIFAQSIGGGGGVGGAATTNGTGGGNQTALSVGGSGAGGGNGGDVNVTIDGNIETDGARSHGVVALSVGGGGGYGGSASSNSGTSLSIGGSGAAGGDGGDVTVIRNGQITTTGADSIGIIAQSIGGGGGYAGSGVGRFDGTGVDFSFFKDGGVGVGGIVTITQNAGSDILTMGDRSHGIFAQGVGGGGGVGGFGTLAMNSAFAGSAGGFGNAQAVSTTAMSDVRAFGGSAYGIFGQSAAGEDSASTVTLKVQKVARATGANSVAVYGESTGGAGQANIEIEISDNVVWGGSGEDGAGVLFVGGVNNKLMNNGTLTALNNMAIAGDLRNEAIINTRHVIGNMEMRDGTNTFENQIPGLLITDEFIHLTNSGIIAPPSANLLTNAGTLALGGVDVLNTTELWGNLVQTTDGKLPLDIDLNTQSTDRINITGTAKMAGTGPLLFQSIDQKFTEYTIVSTQGGVDPDFTFVPTMDPPAVGFRFMARRDNADKDVILFAEKPPFAELLENSGVTDPNVFRMGNGLTEIENALDIDDPFNRLINLLRFQPSEEDLGIAIVTLTPSAAPHVYEFARRRVTSFLDATDECPEFQVDAGIIRNGGCVWATGLFSEYRREDVLGAPKTSDEYNALTIGMHGPISDSVSIGFGLERGEGGSVKERHGLYLSDTGTDVWQGALNAAYRDGRFAMGVSIAGSLNNFDTRRIVKIDGFQQNYTTYDGIQDNFIADPSLDEQAIFSDRVRVFEGIDGDAEGSSDLWAVNPRLRFSYAFGAPSLQITPYFDVEAFFARIDAYAETGAGLANLEYARVSQNQYSVTPGIEVATQAAMNETLSARTYVRGGITLTRGDEWEIETQFSAAPEGLSAIKITEPYDETVAKIDAGIQLLDISGMELRFEYNGAFSDTTTQHDGSGSLRFRF